MGYFNGIFAATLSILNSNLELDCEKTLKHAENLIEKGCHGIVFFGSTGQSQLISLSEKIKLINILPKSKYKDKFIIGTGLNSLSDNVSLMKISKSIGFENFLIMPPAYYKYNDEDVIKFYSRLVESVKESKIILYNFEKLSGYKFSKKCITELAEKFPNIIVGVKDSSYNLYEDLKIKDFSILPGSETKLLKSLKLGCSGIITATTNVTAFLARDVYDKYKNNSNQTLNEKLCLVRGVFDKFNLISALHTLMSKEDNDFKNLIPPLKLLSNTEEKIFFSELEKLNFNLNKPEAA
ncbi:dapA [Pelagibacteraceae bacterium GOM-A4]|nr:dapA [Pelagibacteraceae bacterium GOM-A4]